MVGIARFAKKVGSHQGTTAAENQQHGNDAATSIQPRDGRSKAPRPPPKGDTEMDIFGGGNDFQDDGGIGFGDHISMMNGGHGYRDEFDLGGQFYRERPSTGGDGDFFGRKFDGHDANDFGLSHNVDMTDDTAGMGDKQVEGSKSEATSGGLSRFSKTQEEGQNGAQNDNAGRFSKTQRERSGSSTGLITSKNDAATAINQASRGQTPMGLSRFSKGWASSIKYNQGGLATLAEAASNEHSTIISMRGSGGPSHRQVPQGPTGGNQFGRDRNTGETIGSDLSMGSNTNAPRQREGNLATEKSGDGHFNKILPSPTQQNGPTDRPRPQQEPMKKNAAVPPQTATGPRPGPAGPHSQEKSDHSAAARSGMARFTGANLRMETPGQTFRNPQMVVPPSHVNRPTGPAVSPYSVTPKATTTATITITGMGGQEYQQQFTDSAAHSSQRQIDMGYESNRRPDINENQEARRVSLEESSMQGQATQSTVTMQRQNQKMPADRRIQATHRNSFVHDPRRVSLEAPDKAGLFDSRMEEASPAGGSQQEWMNDSTFNEENDPTNDWILVSEMEHRMEGLDEEMLDPSLFTFEGQSQAFLEAHEQTKDLQSEICADLHKLRVQFHTDHPALLLQCDELWDLLLKCEDLEKQADNAMNRFQNVISAIPEDEVKEVVTSVAKEVEPAALEEDSAMEAEPATAVSEST